MGLGVIDQAAVTEIGELERIGMDAQLGGSIKLDPGIDHLSQPELQL